MDMIECDTCNKKYCSIIGLKRHIKMVHDKIKDYLCDICKYACSEMRSLKRHIKSKHDKIKNHRCEKCSFRSGIKYNLSRHIERMHTTNKRKDTGKNIKEVPEYKPVTKISIWI